MRGIDFFVKRTAFAIMTVILFLVGLGGFFKGGAIDTKTPLEGFETDL